MKGLLRNTLILGIVIVVVLWISGAFEPEPNWDGALAPDDPVQTKTDLPDEWVVDEYTYEPAARYSITAVVLSKKKYGGLISLDPEYMAPYDLALGWGPMSDSDIINQLKITQSGRWYRFSWDGEIDISGRDISNHSANVHIVPADDEVLRVIRNIDENDVVELDGYLVHVTRDDGWEWRTSLSRTDTGSGSCELMWVEYARIVPS